MIGQQRLEIVLDLHEFGCNIARARIRQQFPPPALRKSNAASAKNRVEAVMSTESQLLVDVLFWLNSAHT